MKIRSILTLCLVLLFAGPAESSAQGLGGILKKVKKGVESVTRSSTPTATAATPAQKGTVVPVEGGGTLRNPLPGIVDVQLVGAYGKSTSANYGEVNLVFKVKMIANLTELKFGANSEYPALMIDQDGNAYKQDGTAGWYPYSVTEGVYMKIPLKDSAAFKDVKRTATVIQQLQIGISSSYSDTGLIILKDVPVQWDVEP